MIAFRIQGLQELREALRRLPEELRDEGGSIVKQEAEAALAEIGAGYDAHQHTGFLRDHLSLTTVSASAYGTRAIVRNTAPHAWIFENGSQTRRSRSGNASPMPPGHVFIPATIRHRDAMYDDLARLLERAGLRVTRAS